MPYPLYVALLWHMHQPYYRDAASGDFALPWVRLHATKDYLHMAEVLADYPTIHATFNFVPSLIEQLEDYASGSATDRALRISLKDQLSAQDKEFILSFFFSINWEHILNRYPPYRELLRQRDEVHGDWRRLPDQYWPDLIVWFNLAWFDPGYIRRDPELQALVEKGSNFSRADVEKVAVKSRSVAGPTLAAYRKLIERGQIEVSTSPYYHPILPLLVDITSAREATPGLPLPRTHFAYPEDAIEQVRRALVAHERVFGRPPHGLWPPEGSVSQAVAELLGRSTDLHWIASDEAILARSIGASIERDQYGHVTNPHLLYQPYALRTGDRSTGRPLAIFFRDRVLSDRIGFVYQHMDSQAAAADLVHRLHRAWENLGDRDRPYVVPIILDGENCWECYENNGDDFLRCLYGLLTADDRLKTVTMSEYLEQFPPRSTISNLAAGSWIGGDLLTWIGEPAQNEAWEYLARTRQQIVLRAAHDAGIALDVIGHAWRELYIAEGSDWFWWYSSRNNPGSDVFDVQFRGHLAEVYRNLGLPVPQWLLRPILVSRPQEAGRSPHGYVMPVLDASTEAGYGWARAGYMEPQLSSATMQRNETLLRRFYYGYDEANLYLRFEMSPSQAVGRIVVYFTTPHLRANRTAPQLQASALPPGDGEGWTHELAVDMASQSVTLKQADGYEGWRTIGQGVTAAFGSNVVEVRLSLADLELSPGDLLSLVIAVGRDGIEERHPSIGHLDFRIIRFDA